MKLKNATKADLRAALRETNERYEGNLTLKGGPDGFTLGVRESSGAGGRFGRKLKKDGTRRLANGRACWHAHGHFFEAVFARRPGAEISAGKRRIIGPDKRRGNWRDARVVGVRGLWYSNLCACERGIVTPQRPRKMPRVLAPRPGAAVEVIS